MHVILAILLSLPATAVLAAEPWTGPPVVVTYGEAVLRVTPDRAFVQIRTEARAPAPKAAQQEDAKAMAAVQQQLREAGIPEAAVRTVGYDLQQEFDYVGGKQVSRGYVARHTIEVRVDEIAQLGDVIAKAVGSGAAAVAGIRFDAKERDQLEREALRKAVEDARGRADAAAAGAGTSVAGLVKIEEQRTFEGPRPMMMKTAAMAAEAVATPIAAGEIEIRSSVALTSAIK